MDPKQHAQMLRVRALELALQAVEGSHAPTAGTLVEFAATLYAFIREEDRADVVDQVS